MDLVGKSLGRYQILAQLGHGGMASVYKAWDSALNHHVALKVLLPHLAGDLDFVERFHREAKNAARLNHPNIVRVHEVGRQGEAHYLVMDYVEGESLHTRLVREKMLSLQVATSIVTQIGSALDHAHAQGLIHRDVKPSNILLDDHSRAFLSDFGIAKAVAGTKLTRTGTSLGTPEYMSPEQVLGKTIDGRSDLYSLGVVLYEMVTGQAPFTAETAASVLYRHVYTPPPLPTLVNPRLPAALSQVMLKALAKDARERYQSGHEMEIAVRESLAPPTQTVARPAPRRASPVVIILGAIAAAVLVIAVVVGTMWRGLPGRDAALVGLASSPTVVATTATPSAVPTSTATLATSTPIPTRSVTPTRTVTRTPTADPIRAFANPILSAIANKPPTWSDDFSDPGSGWPIGGTDRGEWGYKDGAYYIQAHKQYVEGQHCCDSRSPRMPQFSNFVSEVEGEFVSGESGNWGIVFRESPGTFVEPNSGHYKLLFEVQGVRFFKWVNLIKTDLWQSTPVFYKRGYTKNRVQIIAHGASIAVYLNGEPLFLLFDESLRKGAISLTTQNNSDSPLRTQFDNLKVWDISGLAIPGPAVPSTGSLTPTLGSYVLSGGPDPNTFIRVDDDLSVFVDGRAVFVDNDGANTDDSKTWKGSPIGFSALPNSKLRITASDNGSPIGGYNLGTLYLHTPEGKPHLLTAGVAPKKSTGSAMVFFDETYDLAMLK